MIRLAAAPALLAQGAMSEASPLTYTHRPRPFSADVTLRLEDGTLAMTTGLGSSDVSLADIVQVRLLYAPTNLSRKVYRTILTLKDGRRIGYGSVAWRSIADLELRNEAYSAFSRALIAGISTANPDCRWVKGHPWLQWILVCIIGAGAGLGVASLVWTATRDGQTSAAVLGALIGAVAFWQIEPLIRLNRPDRFDPRDPPAALLPSG